VRIPSQLPGLKLLTIVWGMYTAVWITLEGAVWSVVGMGLSTALVVAGYGWQHWLGGRMLSPGAWLGGTAVTGFSVSAGGSLLSLVFMALKTGLHAHGPEFTAVEISWVWEQLPLWAIIGLLVGLGLGMIGAALARPDH